MVVSTTVMTAPLALACKRPSMPTLPNAETVVIAEVVEAKKAVIKYMEEAEKYLGCSRVKKRQDKIMEQMRIVSSDFNYIVQIYKERARVQKALAQQ